MEKEVELMNFHFILKLQALYKMITKYDILNPITDKKSPFYNKQKGLFYFPTVTGYKYFLECSKINPLNNDIEFYILLGKTKFDPNCKSCHLDNYGRCQLKISGKIKEFVLNELEYRGNFIMEYVETEDGYDVFELK